MKISTLIFSNLLHFTLLFSEDKNNYLFKFASLFHLFLSLTSLSALRGSPCYKVRKVKRSHFGNGFSFLGELSSSSRRSLSHCCSWSRKANPFWQRVSLFWRNYDLPFLNVVLGQEVKIGFWHGCSLLPQPAQGSDGVSPPLVRFPPHLLLQVASGLGNLTSSVHH